MTARVLALAQSKNKTLQYIDLESNDLTHESQKNGGVEELINALFSLNEAKNRLD